MARINELRLTVSGSGRSARFLISGFIDYDTSEVSVNGCYLSVIFYGADGTSNDVIRGRQLWTIRGRVTEDSVDLDAWRFTAISPLQTRFTVRFENENTGYLRRSFNEDKPGRDEIYCWVQLRDAIGNLLTEGQNSNVVSGWF
jgi:hypothetical protein